MGNPNSQLKSFLNLENVNQIISSNKILLFDDYHLPGKVEKDINCSNLIDQIEDNSKELIIMDRRIFFDDRGYTDDEINYGQVLLTKA